MATAASEVTAKRARRPPLAPDAYERALALAAVLLTAALIAALAGGHGRWGHIPPMVWAHILTVTVALVLTPVMLLRPRGGPTHRRLGRIWVSAMLLTALSTLFVQESRPGHYSFIHIFTVWTLLAAPYTWWTARTGRIAAHRGSVRGLVTGALLIAGAFTLVPGRVLGGWIWG
jgi:uncharacterized membrane protein